MTDDGVWWRAQVGGMILMWPDSWRSPEVAKALRISKGKAKNRYDAEVGRRHERVAKLLVRAATGRIVPLEEIDLRPATAADKAWWDRMQHTADVLAGKGGAETVDQPELFATGEVDDGLGHEAGRR